MAAVTVGLIGFFAFLILRVTAPQMTPLFTDLTFEDSAAIVKDLERQAIPYEIKNDGAIVLVPRGSDDSAYADAIVASLKQSAAYPPFDFENWWKDAAKGITAQL